MTWTEAILLANRVVMMTNGSHAHIGKIMRVDIPRPPAAGASSLITPVIMNTVRNS
ncbi:MAG: hypothetical protein FD153_638 [Rhodospirillaceae bacterium]|nr:MAG: hypothetical protein FD153_638 [Rhodospirillaceae bacterium]